MVKFYVTGTRRGLGYELWNYFEHNLLWDNVYSLAECDVFINCKHDGFKQVDHLFDAAKLKKRIINIGSNASNGIKPKLGKYAIEKAALEKANEQLFQAGINTTIIKFGFIDTERVSDRNVPKIDIEYARQIIMWIFEQPYRIKEITICP